MTWPIYILWFFCVLLCLGDCDFTHIFQCYFTDTGAIIWLTQCQWSSKEEYRYMDHNNTLLNNKRHSAIYLCAYFIGYNVFNNTFKCVFLNENCCGLMEISHYFIHKHPINNIHPLVQIIVTSNFFFKCISLWLNRFMIKLSYFSVYYWFSHRFSNFWHIF